MPTVILMLTAIPGLCQGDTWTPDGDGSFPQIIHTDGDGDAEMAGYLVFVCEDEEHPPLFPTTSAAVAWLNGLNIQEGDQGTITYVLEVDREACPGCGCKPGDGINPNCNDMAGCGYWRAEHAALEASRLTNTINQALTIDQMIARLQALRAEYGNLPITISSDPRDVDVDLNTAPAVAAQQFCWYELEAVVICSPNAKDED